jgi:SAM-dependent methyltransferase
MLKNIKRFLKRQKSKKRFYTDYLILKKQQEDSFKRFDFNEQEFYPCLDDNTTLTGFDRHYVYHPAWAMQIVKKINPKKHIDISSSLHFCANLSAFIPVDFYDFRPAKLALKNLNSLEGNLLALPFKSNSVDSISCMHTVEHIGLGRYGDPLDYDGDMKAIGELKRVLAVNGNLLFVTPLGAKNRICFNAHRIYTKKLVLELFSDLELVEFTLIPENEEDGGLVVNPSDELLNKQMYGCGCFWFKKIK